MENNNNDKKWSWLKIRIDLIITILALVIGFTIAWTQLQAKVINNSRDIEEINLKYNTLLTGIKEINNSLNNPDYGLAVIHQRLKTLEKR